MNEKEINIMFHFLWRIVDAQRGNDIIYGSPTISLIYSAFPNKRIVFFIKNGDVSSGMMAKLRDFSMVYFNLPCEYQRRIKPLGISVMQSKQYKRNGKIYQPTINL
jgi:hypothetical protein